MFTLSGHLLSDGCGSGRNSTALMESLAARYDNTKAVGFYVWLSHETGVSNDRQTALAIAHESTFQCIAIRHLNWNKKVRKEDL